ncbi:DUF342 domain-containing protein [Thermicanus aegyptius]|uniref:DUF342 domain-containing protein n=1 Tax=Thermicanus aegyptius TaxID=94009 RepID=UPI0003F8B98D|nr:FapA family protein [Thermicanus aegyptius]
MEREGLGKERKKYPLWHLHIEPLKVRLIVKQGEGEAPFTEEEVKRRLMQEGIKLPIQEEELRVALHAPPPGEYLLAEGTPPENGKDGWVEWFVQTQEEHRFVEENGRINYLDFFRIPSVAAGDRIAQIFPPQPGREGSGVRGEPIPPPPVRAVNIALGQGVRLDEEGKVIYATINGYLKVKTKSGGYHISVAPTLIQSGDVDLSTGNIRFRGDIQISGNINEGMTVEADGDIRVGGNVMKATVKAGGSILVQGQAIGSHLSAGVSPLQELKFTLEKIKEDLEKVDVGIHQISQTPQGKWILQEEQQTILPVVKLLIQKINPRIGEEIKELAKERQKISLPKDWLEVIDGLQQVQAQLSHTGGSPPDITYVRFQKLLLHLKQLLKENPAEDKKDVKVVLSSLLNSKVESKGDVEVTQRGGYHSIIDAGGSVRGKGSYRGGEIRSGHRVELEEVGSQAGVRTLVEVLDPEGVVRLNKVYPETEVLIGGKGHFFTREEAKVSIRIKEGEIHLTRG